MRQIIKSVPLGNESIDLIKDTVQLNSGLYNTCFIVSWTKIYGFYDDQGFDFREEGFSSYEDALRFFNGVCKELRD